MDTKLFLIFFRCTQMKQHTSQLLDKQMTAIFMTMHANFFKKCIEHALSSDDSVTALSMLLYTHFYQFKLVMVKHKKLSLIHI